MKITKLYKKLTLANFLNWFAMRFLRVAKSITGYIISTAISLDPSRENFQKNLDSLKLNRVLFFRKVTLPYFSVLEGAKKLGVKIVFYKEGEVVNLELPQVINDDFKVDEAYACEAKLPDVYLAEINDAYVLANTDLIVVDKTILYDQINKDFFDRYPIKSPLISSASRDSITVKWPLKSASIERGIHLSKDHTQNYYHWLIENLPRLSLISELDKNIPLLVDGDLPKQFYDALAILNQDNREIIKLGNSTIYKVGKLYYPSQLSIFHDSYSNPFYGKDVLYSAKAISYVRDTVLKKIGSHNGSTRRRKLYISRKNSYYRQLINSEEIEDALVVRGFEIIFPEYLSFFAQAQLFSEAEMIVGQSGGGMSSFIFAPKDCKILMMMSDVTQSNFHIFGALAQSMGLSLKYILGKDRMNNKSYINHSDFYVDVGILIKYLEEE